MLVGAMRAEAQSDTPRLDSVFKAGSQRADYIVAVDRSGSMQDFWPSVREALSTLALAIPDGEYLSIILFNRNAKNTRILPRVLDAGSRSSLLTEIKKLPASDKADGSGDYGFTDLGAALESVIKEQNRPGANALQFVFLFTDFVHDPAAASTYRARNVNDPAWRALVARGAQLRTSAEGGGMETFAFILPLDKQAGRDLSLVRGVLGEVNEIAVQGNVLRQWFARQAVEIRRAKLRIMVGEDLRKGMSYSLRQDGVDGILDIRSSVEKLPLDLVIDSLTIAGERVRISSSASLELRPNGSAQVGVSLERCVESMGGWRKLLKTRRVMASDSAKLFARALPGLRDELLIVGAENTAVPLRPGTAKANIYSCGTPLWQQSLMLGGLVLLVGAVGWYWRPASPLTSYLNKIYVVEGAQTKEYRIPQRVREITIGQGEAATVPVRWAGEDFAIVVASRGRKFGVSPGKRGAVVYARRGFVRVETRPGRPASQLGRTLGQATRLRRPMTLEVGGGSDLTIRLT